MGKDNLKASESQVNELNPEVKQDKIINKMLKSEKRKKYFAGFSHRNYTACYQEITENMICLTEPELRVLLWINHQTRGYKRDFSWFVLDEFVHGIRYTRKKKEKKDKPYYFEGTGLNQSSVSKALKNLLKRGYLEKKIFCKSRNCGSELPQKERPHKRLNKKTSEVVTHWRQGVDPRCHNCHKPTKKNITVKYSFRYKGNAGELPEQQSEKLLLQQSEKLSTVVNLSIVKKNTSTTKKPSDIEKYGSNKKKIGDTPPTPLTNIIEELSR